MGAGRRPPTAVPAAANVLPRRARTAPRLPELDLSGFETGMSMDAADRGGRTESGGGATLRRQRRDRVGRLRGRRKLDERKSDGGQLGLQGDVAGGGVERRARVFGLQEQ